ncbi:MAG: ATP-dependent DNA helicase RecG, partial [Cytophagia bacterium]|nr:ATP-dependent DNA helicase RecG [Cytophagia bacterium]
MPEHPLFYDLAYLKGIGPQRAAWLESELGLKSFYDLLTYFPYRYLDRSEIHPLGALVEGPAYVQTRGTLCRIERVGVGKASRLVAILTDGQHYLELI